MKVVPRSSQSKCEWQTDGSLKIWTSAPPVDGEANSAVVIALSKVFHRPVRDVKVVKGTTSRSKQVRIEGITLQQAHELLP